MERRCIKAISHYIPFIFNADYGTASYSGIKCRVRARKSCYVQALWGVPMDKLHKFLSNEIEIVRNAINTCDPSQMFSKYCVDCHPSELIAANEEKVYEFKPNVDIETVLVNKATPRRDCYPFVLMVVKADEEFQDSSVIAMANVIHVPDRLFQHYPYLIVQLGKLSSGDIGEVKKIYHSSSPVVDNDGNQSDVCLVCYGKPVSVVYLPCRHACVCSDCNTLCGRCPVCRSSSSCYFQLSNPERN